MEDTLEQDVEKISIQAPVQEPEELSLMSSSPKVLLPDPATASRKAEKIDFSLGAISPGKEEIANSILAGLENDLRDRSMVLEKATFFQERQHNIKKFTDSVAASGRALSEDDLSHINSMMTDKDLEEATRNPDTYFEKRYAQRVVDFSLTNMFQAEELQHGKIPTAVRESDAYRGLQSFIAKQEGFRKLGEEMEQRSKEQSLGSFIGDIGIAFVPGSSWWLNKDAVAAAPTSSVLPGSNIKEQIEYLNNIQDPDLAILEARTAIEDIAKVSLLEAKKFASYLTSYSETDKFIENFFGGLDVGLTVAPFIGKTVKGLSAVIAGSAGRTASTIPGVLDATGQTARAAFSEVQRRVANTFQNSGARPNSFNDIANQIDTIANPAAVLSDVGNTPFSREFADRLENLLYNQSTAIASTGLLDPINITRIQPGTQAYVTAMQETERLFRVQYPHINDAIIAIRPIRSAENALGNTDHIAVQLGRKTGDLFDEAYEAEAVARLWGLKGYTVQPRGNKFYIELTKAVDETLPSVRASLAFDTANNPTPNTFLGKFLGYFRTRDNLVSTDINRELKVATVGAQQLSNLSQSIMARAFNDLPRWRSASRQNFMQFITAQRDYIHPTTRERGRFSNTVGEFTSDWQTMFGRLPSEQEATAYFTYKQVNDGEYMMNNLRVYRGKSRLGFENWNFKLRGELPATGLEKKGIKQKYVKTPDIEGRLVGREDIIGDVNSGDRLFSPDDSAGIMVWDDANSAHMYFQKNSLTMDDRAIIDNMIHDGYRIVQLSDFGAEALRSSGVRGLPNGHVRYVLVKNYETSPLSLHQMPYRPGGHVEYADNFFVSQPNINPVNFRGTVIHDYLGDRTVLSARTLEEARNFAGLMDNARLLLHDPAALRQFLVRNRMPWSFQEFTRLFDESRGGILNPNLPILARPKGNSLAKEHKLDAQYVNFRDPINSPHNPFNEDVNLRYAMERNEQLHRILNYGTDLAPILGLVPSRLLDPAATIGRSLSSMASSRYLDDLKIKAAERFVAEFGDLLVGNAEELRRYPMKSLADGVINKAHGDKARIATAQNYQRTMKEFLSMKTPELRRSEVALMRLYETLRPRVGAQRAEDLSDRWIDSWAAHTIDDPVRFIRQAAFYPKMGFYNLKQLFLQAGGVVHTAALEGMPRALNASIAGQLMRPLHLSNGSTHLQHIANMSTSWGYASADHFKESYLALQRTGFQNVGGEYGSLDDFLSPGVAFNSVSGKALDSSLYFFKKGEQVNRLTAWNASYLRWRDANPLAKFNDNAIKEVLERADLLTMNMTRASNGSWNTGISSIATQFFSFQARLMDQIWGDTLGATVRERSIARARIIGTYSMLFGVPVGAGGTALGVLWPFHEQTRKTLMENGIDIDDTAWEPFVNGLPQWAMSMATGGEGPNIAETFGPNGISVLKDFLEGKPEVLIGAGPKSIYQFGEGIMDLVQAGFTHAEPFVTGLFSTGLVDDGKTYKVMTADLQDALDKATEPISAINNAQRAFYALNYGAYVTKNGETVVSDPSAVQAFMAGILGTAPTELNDYYVKLDINKDIDELQVKPRKEAIKWLRRSYDPNNSIDEMVEFKKKASTFKILGNFTERQWIGIIRESAKGYETQMEEIDRRLKGADSVNYNRYLKSVISGQGN